MIDLSYLTEEEKEGILRVLNRDEKLKKVDEKRVRQLEKQCEQDELKYLTGRWFYEAQWQRHGDRSHGSDIIKASLTDSVRFKGPGFEGNQDFQFGPEPSGSPPSKPRITERQMITIHLDPLQEKTKLTLLSPAKQRHNPFNGTSLDLELPESSESHVSIAVDPPKPSQEELMAPRDPGVDAGVPAAGWGPEVDQTPLPKKRTIIYTAQAFLPDCNSILPVFLDGTGVPQYRPGPLPGSDGATWEKEPAGPREEATVVNLNKIQVRMSSSVIPAKPRRLVEKPGKEEPVLLNLETSRLENEAQQESHRATGKNEVRGPGPSRALEGQRVTGRSMQKSLEGSDLYTGTGVDTVNKWNPVQRDVGGGKTMSSAVQNQGLGEEGESIAKVLEWFSKSSDSSDDVNKNICQQDTVGNDANEEPSRGVSTESGKKATSPETQSLKTEEKAACSSGDMNIFQGEVLDGTNIPGGKDGFDLKPFKKESVVAHQPFRSFLNTEKAYQPQRRIAATEIKLRWQKENEGNNAEKGVCERVDPVSTGLKTQHDVQQNEGPDERSFQNVEMLKLFWEKGNGGPKVPISRSNADSKKETKNKFIIQAEVARNDKVLDVLETEKDASQSAGTSLLSETMGSAQETHVPPLVPAVFESKEQSVEEGTGAGEVAEPRSLFSNALDADSSTNSALDLVSTSTHEEKIPTSTESRAWLDWLDELEMKGANKNVVLSGEAYSINDPPHDNSEARETKKEDLPVTVSLSRYATHVQQPTPDEQTENKPSKVGPLKSFWEKETFAPQIVSTPKAETKQSKLTVENASNNSVDCSSVDLGEVLAEPREPKSPTNAFLQRHKPNFTVLSMKERVEKLQVTNEGDSQFKVRGGAVSDGPNAPFPTSENQLAGMQSPSFKGLESTDALQEKQQTPVRFMNRNYDPQISPRDTKKFHIRHLGDEKTFTDTQSLMKEVREKEQPLKLSKEQESSEVGIGSSPEVNQPVPGIKANVPLSWSGRPEQAAPPLLQSPGTSAETSTSAGVDTQSLSNSQGQTERRASGNVKEKVIQQAVSKSIGEEQHKESPVSVKKRHDGNLSGRNVSGPSEDAEVQQPLARSVISHDYQHYLGITEQKDDQHVCKSEKKEEQLKSELDMSTIRISAQNDSTLRWDTLQAKMKKKKHSGSTDGNFGALMSDVPSQSSSSRGSEEQSLVMMALRRASARPVQSYKSLEDITSPATGEERKRRFPRRQSSVADAFKMEESSIPTGSFENPSQVKKMSKSVPGFLQKEGDESDDDDSSSETSLSSRSQRTGSSLTNLSHSSGLASASSVGGSVASLYSEDFGIVDVKGTIQFSISYLQKLKEFHIFVVQCRDLAVADLKKNRSDPYVKSYLLPDKAKMGKRKTSVKKKTLNPVFNEILRYRISMALLQSQTLNLSVWHNDTFGRNSFLGEVDVDLSPWDFKNTPMYDFPLKPRITSRLLPSDYRGEMRLAIRFLPQFMHTVRAANTGEVHIWVKDCKNLPIIRGSAIDPYVKCFVLPDMSRKSRQKTRVVKRTSNPVFNHTMVYDGFQASDLREACVELTAWDRDRLASHFLGGLRLGLGTGRSYGEAVDWMDSKREETALWERMMASPSEWVEGSLRLRMLTRVKKAWP